jgi:hypothetical protein
MSRFDELSRKAATGALSPAERDWLDAHLREHPEKRAELEWDQAFSAKLEEKVASMPTMPGWDRAERALRTAEDSRKADAAARRAPGILDRLSEWFASSFGLPINMQAIAAALVLAQAGVIGVLAWQQRDAEYSDVRAGAQDDAPRGPLLRVSFRQDIREADLRKALADIGGEIVGGPGQIGIYLIRVKDADLRAAAERLRATGLAALVEIHEPKR